LVKLISEISGEKIQIKSSQDRIRPKNSEVDRLLCDNSKLLKNTSWEPKFNLHDGLKVVFDWICNNKSYYKSQIYNI